MDLLDQMHGEESTEPVDRIKVRMTLRRLLHRDYGIVGVIRGKTHIEATVGLDVSAPWNSSKQHLKKIWLFVHPSHRKSPHAKSCLEFARWYSDQVGIPLWAEEICTPVTEKRVELVGRQMPAVGKVFIYNARVAVDMPLVAVTG